MYEHFLIYIHTYTIYIHKYIHTGYFINLALRPSYIFIKKNKRVKYYITYIFKYFILSNCAGKKRTSKGCFSFTGSPEGKIIFNSTFIKINCEGGWDVLQNHTQENCTILVMIFLRQNANQSLRNHLLCYSCCYIFLPF